MIFYFLTLAFLILTPLTAAKAVAPICVICTAAVSAGVGLSRWLGVDDTITGAWLGALAASLSLWTINWSSGKNIKFFGRQPLIFLVYYAAIIWPLYRYNLAGHYLNKLFGADRLILGIIAGSVVFIISLVVNEYLKKKNNGKVYFPFQRVAVPVSALLALSLIFYLIINF